MRPPTLSQPLWREALCRAGASKKPGLVKNLPQPSHDRIQEGFRGAGVPLGPQLPVAALGRAAGVEAAWRWVLCLLVRRWVSSAFQRSSCLCCVGLCACATAQAQVQSSNNIATLYIPVDGALACAVERDIYLIFVDTGGAGFFWLCRVLVER